MGQTSVGSGSVLDKRYDTLRPSHQSPQSRLLNPLAIAMSHVFFSPCQIAICNSGDKARQPERCSVWHPAASCLGPNRACGTFFFFPFFPSCFPGASVNLTRPPCCLLKAIWVRLCHCWLKRGFFFFFCHPLGGRSVGIRGGRRRIINTAASASRCHRNGQLLCCFVFFLLLLDWDAQSFLRSCCGGCSCHCALPDLQNHS